MNFSGLIGNFGEYTVTGLAQGAIYALFALGYTLVYGVLRLINFAHSEVFMVGTFAAIGTWGLMGLNPNSATPTAGAVLLYLAVAIIVAMLASGATGLVVELVAYRPLRRRNAPPLAFLITAIGTSLVISELFGVFTHHNPYSPPPLIHQKALVSFGSTSITNLQLGIVVVALVMMLVLDQFINRSKLGRGIRAVAQNSDAAALMGVNKGRMISLVFLLGGLMAGVAAVLYVLKIGDTRYDAGFYLGIKAFAAAVLGGIGNLRGALVGGLVLGLAENYGAALFGSQLIDIVAFVLLVVMLLFRPTGLLGESLGRARA
jgi:branched-chain amino acid transport system permease protein